MNDFSPSTSITKLINRVFDLKKGEVLPSGWGLLFILLLGLGAGLVQFHQPGESAEVPEKLKNIDIFIPDGESLVPIQVANYESLDQIIGQYGVVDLYTTPLNPLEKGRKVAFAVKLVRAPQSPRHFSVLLPADEAHRLVGYHGEFTVVVRNPKIVGTKFVNNKPQTRKRRVVFETEAP